MSDLPAPPTGIGHTTWTRCFAPPPAFIPGAEDGPLVDPTDVVNMEYLIEWMKLDIKRSPLWLQQGPRNQESQCACDCRDSCGFNCGHQLWSDAALAADLPCLTGHNFFIPCTCGCTTVCTEGTHQEEVAAYVPRMNGCYIVNGHSSYCTCMLAQHKPSVGVCGLGYSHDENNPAVNQFNSCTIQCTKDYDRNSCLWALLPTGPTGGIEDFGFNIHSSPHHYQKDRMNLAAYDGIDLHYTFNDPPGTAYVPINHVYIPEDDWSRCLTSSNNVQKWDFGGHFGGLRNYDPFVGDALNTPYSLARHDPDHLESIRHAGGKVKLMTYTSDPILLKNQPPSRSGPSQQRHIPPALANSDEEGQNHQSRPLQSSRGEVGLSRADPIVMDSDSDSDPVMDYLRRKRMNRAARLSARRQSALRHEDATVSRDGVNSIPRPPIVQGPGPAVTNDTTKDFELAREYHKRINGYSPRITSAIPNKAVHASKPFNENSQGSRKRKRSQKCHEEEGESSGEHQSNTKKKKPRYESDEEAAEDADNEEEDEAFEVETPPKSKKRGVVKSRSGRVFTRVGTSLPSISGNSSSAVVAAPASAPAPAPTPALVPRPPRCRRGAAVQAPGPQVQPAARPNPPVPAAFNGQSKVGGFTAQQHQALHIVTQFRRDLEDVNPTMGRIADTTLWTWCVDEIERRGLSFGKSHGSCKNYWNRYGRELSGFDERVKARSKALATSQQ